MPRHSRGLPPRFHSFESRFIAQQGIMGLFDPLFDFNGDGKESLLEEALAFLLFNEYVYGEEDRKRRAREAAGNADEDEEE